MQQQQSNQQQGAMQQPPQVLTTKDSLYLNDMLSWNLLAMKKAHFAASHCQDPELKAELDKCGQMHQHHFEQILSHLNQGNTGQAPTTM
jgi:spore coat protein CotF